MKVERKEKWKDVINGKNGDESTRVGTTVAKTNVVMLRSVEHLESVSIKCVQL